MAPFVSGASCNLVGWEIGHIIQKVCKVEYLIYFIGSFQVTASYVNYSAYIITV